MSHVHTLGPRWVGWIFYRLATRRFRPSRLPAGHWTPVPSTSRGLYQVIDKSEPPFRLPMSYHGILSYWTEEAATIQEMTDRKHHGPPDGSPGGRNF